MRAHLGWLLVVAACTQAACNQAPTPQKDGPDQSPAEAPGAAESAAPSGAAQADDVMDGCPGEQSGQGCGDTPPADAEKTHFGKAFALSAEESLATAASRLGASEGGSGEETVKVSGTVEAVCQKKGCWMELRDGDASAKVFTYAGEFFLPIGTAKGRKALVEGKLKVKTLTEKFAQHLAEDQGEDPGQVTGPQRKLVLEATSVELL